MQPCVVKPTLRNALCSIQLISALAFATACERIVDPALPTTATLLVPPPVYSKWWALAESCSGVSRPLENVTWFVVPGVSSFLLNKEAVSGYWTGASNRIVLAESSVLDGAVVRHEMLHALIRTSGHPRSAFLGKCAGLVSCTPRCVSDAGVLAISDVIGPALPADSIDVSVQLLPNPPVSDIDGGVFFLVVSAHNRASRPVTVSLNSVTGTLAAPFSFEIRALFRPGLRITGLLDLDDFSTTTFAAGETKKQYFDFTIGNVIRGRTVTTGVYQITGWYGSKPAVLTPVTIGP